MSANPNTQQIDFGEYRQHMIRILGEKELIIVELGLRIQQLLKRVEELEARISMPPAERSLRPEARQITVPGPNGERLS